MQVTDLKAILDYEHNEQWLAALNCYKGIWDHNPTDDVAIRYCFFCWYLIWQWEQIDFPGEDISFEAKITVDNRMGISKAELEHTLSSIACGYSNNFQIEYKCILVHLKRLIPYAFSFSNNTICVAQKDNNTGLVEYGTVESTEITENSLVSARSKIHQDTFCNYEYDIYTGSPNEWNLERPKETGSGQNYFMVYENSSNSSQLDSWFNAVNSLNDKEWQAVSSYGVALVTSAAAGFISGMAVASGGILTPGAITAIVAATGATGTAAVLLTQVGTQCNVCLRAYWNVYNATDNMHF